MRARIILRAAEGPRSRSGLRLDRRSRLARVKTADEIVARAVRKTQADSGEDTDG